MLSRRLNLVAAGFALTALSYGLARFAYGLLLPDIREDLAIGATAAGWIGGGAFAAYCLGLVLALTAGRHFGERAAATAAGFLATAGLSLAAMAGSAWSLGFAMALAGLGTGLTSPPLAGAVARSLDADARPKANGLVNAGTAAGIVLSGLAVTMIGSGWRDLYVGFAVIGGAVTLWIRFALPAAAERRETTRPASAGTGRLKVAGLCAGAFLMGAGSTAIWTFGAEIMRADAGYADGGVALAWIVLGLAGILGAATGMLTGRFGIAAVHRVSVALMAAALAGLAASATLPALPFAVMALFGFAYIVSSGAFLLWGIVLFPARPDLGLGLPFLVLALGQTAGAPLFGYLLDRAGSVTALLCFAAIMAAAAVAAPRADVPEAEAP